MRLLTRDKRFYSQFFSLMLYIALQNLVTYSVSLVDNIMIGRYSQTALSGVALANQIQFLLQMIVGSVGEGVIVIAAQYWGERKKDPIKRVSAIGVWAAMIIGFAFFIVMSIWQTEIMNLLSNQENVNNAALEYIRIIRFTYPIFCLSTVLLASMRSVENVKIGFAIMFASLFINMFLNYCMIFGKLGFREMGVRGAAAATLVARSFELMCAALYVFFADKKLLTRLRDYSFIDKTILKDYIRYATPVILAGASWGLAMFIQTAIISRLSEDAIAANSVAASLFGVLSVFAYGGGNAAGVLTGKLVGEGDRNKLKEYVKSMQIMFVLTGIVTGIVTYLIKEPLIKAYNLENENTITLARAFITVLSITVIGTAYQAPCLTGIVRGGGHTKFVFYNDLIFQWCVVLVLSYLAAFVWELSLVWVFLALKSDQLLKCTVAVFEVNSYRWVKKLTR